MPLIGTPQPCVDRTVQSEVHENSLDNGDVLMNSGSNGPVADETSTFSFKRLKEEHFTQEPWRKLEMLNVIKLLHWQSNELHCKKYIEIDESLCAKVRYTSKFIRSS